MEDAVLVGEPGGLAALLATGLKLELRGGAALVLLRWIEQLLEDPWSDGGEGAAHFIALVV